jgi:hypothetical protein
MVLIIGLKHRKSGGPARTVDLRFLGTSPCATIVARALCPKHMGYPGGRNLCGVLYYLWCTVKEKQKDGESLKGKP